MFYCLDNTWCLSKPLKTFGRFGTNEQNSMCFFFPQNTATFVGFPGNGCPSVRESGSTTLAGCLGSVVLGPNLPGSDMDCSEILDMDHPKDHSLVLSWTSSVHAGSCHLPPPPKLMWQWIIHHEKMYFLVETHWKFTWSRITVFLACLDVCAWLVLILLPHPLHCTCLRITCIVLNRIVFCLVLSCIVLLHFWYDRKLTVVLLISWYFCLHRGYWFIWCVASILHVGRKHPGYKKWSYETIRTPRLQNLSNASMPPFPPCSSIPPTPRVQKPTCSPTRATAAAVSSSNSQVFGGPMASTVNTEAKNRPFWTTKRRYPGPQN